MAALRLSRFRLRSLMILVALAALVALTARPYYERVVGSQGLPRTKIIAAADDGDDAVRSPVASSPVKLTASSRVKSARVIVAKDGSVEIAVDMDLFDRRKQPLEYLWRVRVYSDPSPMGVRRPDRLTLLHDFPYTSQRFRLPASGKMSPTFRETLGLDPGRYTVFVGLYEIPAGFDPARLAEDDELARSMQLAHHGQQVEVPE